MFFWKPFCDNLLTIKFYTHSILVFFLSVKIKVYNDFHIKKIRIKYILARFAAQWSGGNIKLEIFKMNKTRNG